MSGNLETTNLLLAIMAAVSVIQGVLLIAAGIAGWMLYRRVTAMVSEVEARHIAPAMLRVNAVIDEVSVLAARMRADTEHVERAIRHTIDRVGGTTARVKADVRSKTSWIVGAVRGVTVTLRELLKDRSTHTRTDYATPGRTH